MSYKTRPLCEYIITKTDLVMEKVIPFFNKYPLQGSKYLDFSDFNSVAELIKNKAHITSEGFESIKQIKLVASHTHKKRINKSLITNVQQKRTYITSQSRSNTSQEFNEWLSGLIDGDGKFFLSKKGYAGLEITMDIRDERALQAVKNVYGGSIKLRSNAKALRYRLHHKEGLLRLINDVNGLIRNSYRLVQLNKVCIKYDLNLISPENLTFNNGWLSGFFDADGSISINKASWQLSLSATQKTAELLNPLIEIYGGYVYIDNGSSQSFKWYITKREDVLKLLEYFKNYHTKSDKIKRIILVKNFYELKDMKAHKISDDYLLDKSWVLFYKKWLNYE